MRLSLTSILTVASLAVASVALALAAGQDAPPVRSVTSLDAQRYSGTWYELARLPNSFQAKCEGNVTATYQPTGSGAIKVINRCRAADSTFAVSVGRATPVKGDDSGAKLKVSFLPTWLRWMPVGRGDYWVVMLDADYRYAVVSEPSREYLWILSRTPQMDGALYDGIVARLRADGYPVNRLVQTPQAAAAPQVARHVPLV